MLGFEENEVNVSEESRSAQSKIRELQSLSQLISSHLCCKYSGWLEISNDG